MGLGSAADAVRGRVRSLAKRVRRAVRVLRPEKPFDPAAAFTDNYRSLPLDPNLVLYQAHSGAAMACNPFAIFTELLADPAYAHLQHVWVLDSAAEIRRRRAEYAGHAGVRFVSDGSPGYVKALATAKYLIQNTTFSAFFVKRPGQVYVMTWHAAGAMKKMGFDTAGGNASVRNVVRNLLMADHIVAPNAMKAAMFTESYRLRGLYRGRLLEFGYPRNDVTLHTERADVVDELRSRGVQVDPAKKIVLYAPTWRGTLGDVRGDAEELEAVREAILAGIDSTEYQVLIKPHNYLYSRLTKEEKRSGRFIPRQFNANRLLAAVDVLVSDYSSIFFDFLVTGRPVLFYLPDLAEYTAERGVYLALDDLPGPVTADLAELADWINDLPAVMTAHTERYAQMLQRACTHDDGQATRRTIQAVFGGRDLPGVTKGLIDPRQKRVLLHTSTLDDAETTEALLALEASLDPERYDVTVAGIGHSPQSRANTDRIVSRALVQTGRFTVSAGERRAVEALRRRGATSLVTRLLRPGMPHRREWHRRFGDAVFDVVVECSPRPGVFGWLAALDERAKLVLWEHPARAAAPAETGTPTERITRPLTRASLRRLRRRASAVVTGQRMSLPEWEKLLDSL